MHIDKQNFKLIFLQNLQFGHFHLIIIDIIPKHKNSNQSQDRKILVLSGAFQIQYFLMSYN